MAKQDRLLTPEGASQETPEQKAMSDKLKEMAGNMEYKKIPGIDSSELESLEGDERGFAEFIEKRNIVAEAIGPLEEFASQEKREKLADALNFLSKIGHENFASVARTGEQELKTVL